jgi:hypothetical protein
MFCIVEPWSSFRICCWGLGGGGGCGLDIVVPAPPCRMSFNGDELGIVFGGGRAVVVEPSVLPTAGFCANWPCSGYWTTALMVLWLDAIESPIESPTDWRDPTDWGLNVGDRSPEGPLVDSTVTDWAVGCVFVCELSCKWLFTLLSDIDGPVRDDPRPTFCNAG